MSIDNNQKNQFKKGPIASNAKSGLYGIWIFALFWNALSWPMVVVGRHQLLAQFHSGDWLPLLFLNFPLIGLFVFLVAIKKTLEWRRFGMAPLSLDPFPGSIGGHVAGFVQLPGSVPTNVRYDISLVCVYTYETRNADNKRTSAERMIWQNSQVGRLRRGMNGMDLRFCFDVPEGLPRSEKLSSNYHHWRVHIHAEMEGVDLDRSFDIPVHPTNEHTSLNLREDHRKNANSRLEQLTELMQVESLPGLLHLRFPMGRRKKLGASLFLLGTAFVVSGAFLLRQGVVGDDGLMVTAMGLLFILAGLPISTFGLYKPFNALDVKITNKNIQVRRSVLGAGLYCRQIAIAKIQTLVLKEGLRSQSGNKHNVEYNVIAIGLNGEELVLAEGLNSKPLAEEALRFIRANANLVV